MEDDQIDLHLNSIEDSIASIAESQSSLRHGFTKLLSSCQENTLLLRQILDLVKNPNKPFDEPKAVATQVFDQMLDGKDVTTTKKEITNAVEIEPVNETEVFDQMPERIDTVTIKTNITNALEIEESCDVIQVFEQKIVRKDEETINSIIHEIKNLDATQVIKQDSMLVVDNLFDEILKPTSDETWMFGDNDETELIDNGYKAIESQEMLLNELRGCYLICIKDHFNNKCHYRNQLVSKFFGMIGEYGFDPGGRYEYFSDFVLMSSNTFRIPLYNFHVVDECLLYTGILNELEMSFMSMSLHNMQGWLLTQAFLQSKLFDPGISLDSYVVILCLNTSQTYFDNYAMNLDLNEFRRLKMPLMNLVLPTLGVMRSNHGFNDLEKGYILPIDGDLISFLVCELFDGAELKFMQHLNVRGTSSTLPSIRKKDRDDIKPGEDNTIDFYVVSFVKDAEVVHELKQYLKSCDVDIHTIIKIESVDSIPNLHPIIIAYNGTMDARGDLGTKLLIKEVLLQDETINTCQSMGKFVIMATNMLESMIVRPKPTRAKVSTIAIVVCKGVDTVMLYGETAHEKFPLKIVKVMDSVALQTKATVSGGAMPNNLGQAFTSHTDEKRIQQRLAYYQGSQGMVNEGEETVYKLELSDSIRIHLMFHVPLLKSCNGHHPTNYVIKQWLIPWEELSLRAATLDDNHNIFMLLLWHSKDYPRVFSFSFPQPCGQGCLEGVGNVMSIYISR